MCQYQNRLFASDKKTKRIRFVSPLSNNKMTFYIISAVEDKEFPSMQ